MEFLPRKNVCRIFDGAILWGWWSMKSIQNEQVESCLQGIRWKLRCVVCKACHFVFVVTEPSLVSSVSLGYRRKIEATMPIFRIEHRQVNSENHLRKLTKKWLQCLACFPTQVQELCGAWITVCVGIGTQKATHSQYLHLISCMNGLLRFFYYVASSYQKWGDK